MTGADDGLERAVIDLHRQVNHRYFGKYRGRVVDNEDPENCGRLKLCVGLLGKEITTGWAEACVPYGGAEDQGMLMIPDRGAGVWVEFAEGDLDQPIWVGTYWSRPPGPTELPRPNGSDGSQAGGVQGPPTRKIWKTGKGHTIQFEDKDGEEAIILVEGQHKHFVRLDQDGIALQDAAGNSLVMTSSAVTLTAKADLTIDAGKALVLRAATIDLKKLKKG